MIRLGAIWSLPAKHYCWGWAAVSASASLAPGMVWKMKEWWQRAGKEQLSVIQWTGTAAGDGHAGTLDRLQGQSRAAENWILPPSSWSYQTTAEELEFLILFSLLTCFWFSSFVVTTRRPERQRDEYLRSLSAKVSTETSLMLTNGCSQNSVTFPHSFSFWAPTFRMNALMSSVIKPWAYFMVITVYYLPVSHKMRDSDHCVFTCFWKWLKKTTTAEMKCLVIPECWFGQSGLGSWF